MKCALAAAGFINGDIEYNKAVLADTLGKCAGKADAVIFGEALYYRVVVIRAPLQGLCYTVRDAVDWSVQPTARRFKKGSNHSPLQDC